MGCLESASTLWEALQNGCEQLSVTSASRERFNKNLGPSVYGCQAFYGCIFNNMSVGFTWLH